MSYVHLSRNIYGRWTSVDRLKTFLHLLEEGAVFGGDMFIHKLRNLGFEQCNAAE